MPPSFNERPIIFLNILPYRYWSFLSVISAFLSMHHQCLWQPKANSLGVFILSFSVMELILPKNFKKPSLYVFYLLTYLRKYLGYYNCFFFNVGSSYHCEAGTKVFDGMVITFLADWYSWARFRRRTFLEPNRIHWIRFMKSSTSESVRNSYFKRPFPRPVLKRG